MAGLDARSSDWASSESPLHAFSLTDCDADARAAGANGRGWRQSLGELWSQVAQRDAIERHADPGSVGVEAKRLLTAVQLDLLALWKGSSASRRSILRCAAVALECSARVWHAFGPVADQRRLHLLRRLEQTLVAADREIRAAELPLSVNRPTINLAANAARAAIDDLLGVTVDRAEALSALEDAAVDLASLAVRIAGHSAESGNSRRTRGNQPAELGQQLEALAGEVSRIANAQRSVCIEAGGEDHLGACLSATLSVAAPTGASELVSVSSGDPCLRADALLGMRARWVELAVGLWVTVQALDDLLVIGTFGEEERLESAASSRAGIALVAGELCRRPGDFDHRHAWARQREGLYELVSTVCLALQTGEPDTMVRGQQLALRRLARALAAIWTIDEQVRSPLAQASRRCR